MRRALLELILLMLYLHLALYVFVKSSSEIQDPLHPPIENNPAEASPCPEPEVRIVELTDKPALIKIPSSHIIEAPASKRAESPRRSIAIVTAYFRTPGQQLCDYDELFQRHLDHSIRYAHLHSYAYFFENSHLQTLDHAKSVWSKLPAVWTHLPHYEWIFWIDADVYVMNFEITIDEILDRANREYDIEDKKKDFLVVEDYLGLNFGVFLMRNSPWALEFLHRVWDMQEKALHEQDAVVKLLKANAADRERTQYLPQRWMNSYPREIVAKHNFRKEKAETHQYQPGDFMMHVPGQPLPRKLEILRKYPPRLPDINITPNEPTSWGLAVLPVVVQQDS